MSDAAAKHLIHHTREELRQFVQTRIYWNNTNSTCSPLRTSAHAGLLRSNIF